MTAPLKPDELRATRFLVEASCGHMKDMDGCPKCENRLYALTELASLSSRLAQAQKVVADAKASLWKIVSGSVTIETRPGVKCRIKCDGYFMDRLQYESVFVALSPEREEPVKDTGIVPNCSKNDPRRAIDAALKRDAGGKGRRENER